jgi:hypothetical protein
MVVARTTPALTTLCGPQTQYVVVFCTDDGVCHNRLRDYSTVVTPMSTIIEKFLGGRARSRAPQVQDRPAPRLPWPPATNDHGRQSTGNTLCIGSGQPCELQNLFGETLVNTGPDGCG